MLSASEGEHIVVLGSAGRRLYLIDWFREAFERLGVRGRVVVAENDRTSAAFTAGDGAWQLPPYDDPQYESELLRLADALRPLAYVSLNDYELMQLGSGIGEKLRARNVVVPGVSPDWMRIVADKYTMSIRLQELQIRTPETYLASQRQRVNGLFDDSAEVIVKHRFGSASSGLKRARRSELDDAIRSSAESAPKSGDSDGLSSVVVQSLVSGPEYGVDVVASLTSPGAFCGALARNKVRMRAGETDKATTVDSREFGYLGRILAKDAQLRGLMDMDVMREPDGTWSVIDINPRFGGGYPFVHLAGADVPTLYLSQILGLNRGQDFLNYSIGVTSAKFEGIRVADGKSDVSSTSNSPQRNVGVCH
ncbi:ATP-grasp domain-containing protein [Citricoccus nitrophenolicus]|uniref:ATP-grasp domain-containing protein n=1 Tax=Citricoccus nitrophenolicus TaxID=863575 RepID=A0ABV0IHR0_9MICC